METLDIPTSISAFQNGTAQNQQAQANNQIFPNLAQAVKFHCQNLRERYKAHVWQRLQVDLGTRTITISEEDVASFMRIYTENPLRAGSNQPTPTFSLKVEKLLNRMTYNSVREEIQSLAPELSLVSRPTQEQRQPNANHTSASV